MSCSLCTIHSCWQQLIYAKVWPVTLSGYTTLCTWHSDNPETAARSSDEIWHQKAGRLHTPNPAVLLYTACVYMEIHLPEHLEAVALSRGSYFICVFNSGNDLVTDIFQHHTHLFSETLSSVNFYICHCEISGLGGVTITEWQSRANMCIISCWWQPCHTETSD